MLRCSIQFWLLYNGRESADGLIITEMLLKVELNTIKQTNIYAVTSPTTAVSVTRLCSLVNYVCIGWKRIELSCVVITSRLISLDGRILLWWGILSRWSESAVGIGFNIGSWLMVISRYFQHAFNIRHRLQWFPWVPTNIPTSPGQRDPVDEYKRPSGWWSFCKPHSVYKQTDIWSSALW